MRPWCIISWLAVVREYPFNLCILVSQVFVKPPDSKQMKPELFLPETEDHGQDRRVDFLIKTAEVNTLLTAF